MNKYICIKCGRFSYSAASLETLSDYQCAYPDCDGHLKEEDLLNRITARTDNGTAYVKSETGEEGVGHFTTQCRLPELISRLAAYEDTGFSPEEINQMQDTVEQLREGIEAAKRDLCRNCTTCKHKGKSSLSEPVRQGCWTMNSNRPDTIICNVCDSGFDVWKHEAKDFQYCPACGARMDAKEDSHG